MAAVAERTEEAVGIMGVSRAPFVARTPPVNLSAEDRVESPWHIVSPWLPALSTAGEHSVGEESS